MNAVWVVLILGGLAMAAATGRLPQIGDAALEGVSSAVELCIGLAAGYALWMGVLRMAERAGLVAALSKLLKRPIRWLFPDIKPESAAQKSIILNLAANMLGLANAATPAGLEAMRHLRAANADSDIASDAMCLFLILNASSVQLFPATVVALRAASGSQNPTATVAATLAATAISTLTGLLAAFILRRLWPKGAQR